MARWPCWPFRAAALLAATLSAVALSSGSDPLFLTPLLEAGQAARARDLAVVPPLLVDCCRSYSGFLTVDKQHDANLFFWFFPVEARQGAAPLVVWLQGGPGTSMMRTVLLENGPYRLAREGAALQGRRGGAWTHTHSMLYFDNPVGTGYSHTRDEAGYSRTMEAIAANLYEALTQFFTLFPEERARGLYIAGESYGGKMAVSLAHYIHRQDAGGAMGLRGVLVINGVLDVEGQLDKSELAYQLGLVDEEGRDEMAAIFQKQLQLVKEGGSVFKFSRDECGSAISPTETGLLSITNLLLFNGTQDYGFPEFAERPDVRAALHVGNSPFKARASAVGAALTDTATSVLPKLAELADHGSYRILVANGQLDLCIPYRLTANVLRKMEWKGAEEWKTASKRVTWCSQGQLAGYARTTGSLTQLLVRNAGHYMPQDQVHWTADMLHRFTSGETFDTC